MGDAQRLLALPTLCAQGGGGVEQGGAIGLAGPIALLGGFEFPAGPDTGEAERCDSD